MKIYRTVFLRLFFLIAVITCSGITVYSNYLIGPHSTEVYAVTNNVENRISSEVNASDDDQVYHSNDTALDEDFHSEIQDVLNCSFILQFSFSVWQPPKIS
jgi:hypothetical protein